MKFEYDSCPEDMSKCVAYLDAHGNLRLKDDGRSSERERGAILIKTSGELKNGYLWDPASASKRFYPGDQLLVTF